MVKANGRDVQELSVSHMWVNPGLPKLSFLKSIFSKYIYYTINFFRFATDCISYFSSIKFQQQIVSRKGIILLSIPLFDRNQQELGPCLSKINICLFSCLIVFHKPLIEYGFRPGLRKFFFVSGPLASGTRWYCWILDLHNYLGLILSI